MICIFLLLIYRIPSMSYISWDIPLSSFHLYTFAFDPQILQLRKCFHRVKENICVHHLLQNLVGSFYSISSFMRIFFKIVVCPFVLPLLAIVLSVLHRIMGSDYPFGIFFKLFLNYIKIYKSISVRLAYSRCLFYFLIHLQK